MTDRRILISAEWDSEAHVFVAESPDVPGLVTEAADSETLVAKLKVMIPELLELNGADSIGNYTLEIAYKTVERVLVFA
jgi:predicted RNase H-like HicB family nuclease